MATPYTALSGIVKSISSLGEELFPSECLNCTKEGPWLCPACQEQSRRMTNPMCPFCSRLSPGGKTCSPCRTAYALTGARSAWYYDGPLATLIKKAKYQGVFGAYQFFDHDLSLLFKTLPGQVQQRALITSVPSRPQTLTSRGFNQSEILAQRLAGLTNRPYQKLLNRAKNKTPSQTKLNRKERLANVQAQFSFTGQTVPTPIIIVDDVITTGATLSSCAAILRLHGARLVWALTLARD